MMIPLIDKNNNSLSPSLSHWLALFSHSHSLSSPKIYLTHRISSRRQLSWPFTLAYITDVIPYYTDKHPKIRSTRPHPSIPSYRGKREQQHQSV